MMMMVVMVIYEFHLFEIMLLFLLWVKACEGLDAWHKPFYFFRYHVYHLPKKLYCSIQRHSLAAQADSSHREYMYYYKLTLFLLSVALYTCL